MCSFVYVGFTEPVYAFCHFQLFSPAADVKFHIDTTVVSSTVVVNTSHDLDITQNIGTLYTQVRNKIYFVVSFWIPMERKSLQNPSLRYV